MILQRIIQIVFVVVFSFLTLTILAILEGGLFGLAWQTIAQAFGYKGTASEAMAQLGSPQVALDWLNQIWKWINDNIWKPLWEWLKSVMGWQ